MKPEYHISTISAKEACVRLRAAGLSLTEPTLYQALAEGAFPFGFCLKRPDGTTVRCVVYEKELERWIQEKAD